MKHANEQIPLQVHGGQVDFSHAQGFATQQEAHQAFLSAAERLVDVSNWHQYAGKASAIFGLTNNLGEAIGGWAAEGLYFYIDLPGPGPAQGDGLEWVRIEKVTADGNADTPEAFLSMTVRPVPDPRKDSDKVAHFFTDAATNTFIASRYGTKVSVEAHGRNEEVNDSEAGVVDKVRNFVVGLPAKLGFSGTQWQTLVKAILSGKTEGE